MIIVPAYNEEKNIGRVLRGLLKLNGKFGEIVIVDDGSIDDTGKIAKENGATVLQHKINRGQGAALETGHQYAKIKKADFVIDFDSDDQMNIDDIEIAVRKLQKDKLDVVLGSRFLDDRSQIPWTKKYFILPIGRFINYLLTGVMLSDAHNGFRVLGSSALQQITINQDKMAHNTEIVRQIKQKNLKYIEIPVEIKYHKYGQRVGGGFEILKDLLVN